MLCSSTRSVSDWDNRRLTHLWEARYTPFSPESQRRYHSPLLLSIPNYGLRLSTAELQFPNSPRRGLAVTCRYGGGGGGGYRFSGDSRRGRPKEAEVDEALDIASIWSATVRLIDGQQNMLGLVSTDEAVRRAEDAELDLTVASSATANQTSRSTGKALTAMLGQSEANSFMGSEVHGKGAFLIGLVLLLIDEQLQDNRVEIDEDRFSFHSLENFEDNYGLRADHKLSVFTSAVKRISML
ncbi:hypothetical protein DY000_02009607 [Brassica cretica]|uniref:Translation initiation factor 3 N-terminal domain-containing protein n=1 Tax=Brassica cretica TaxID=69181 RepID=A0ABQ7C4J0_BRACR|nr:hypothetical protein DY000_02009607 [Brassica cretica]